MRKRTKARNEILGCPTTKETPKTFCCSASTRRERKSNTNTRRPSKTQMLNKRASECRGTSHPGPGAWTTVSCQPSLTRARPLHAFVLSPMLVLIVLESRRADPFFARRQRDRRCAILAEEPEIRADCTRSIPAVLQVP